MNENEAKGGQIWKAKKLIIVKPTGDGRRMVVESGELVEFRFWSPATFRTADGLYLRAEREDFFCSFELHGTIFEEVRFRNENSTREILEAKLYNMFNKAGN